MTQARTQTQAQQKIYTFDEFIEWYPENSVVRYELHDGIIVEMPKPKGKHSKLTGSLVGKFLTTISEIGKTDIWFIPRESIIKPRRDKSGYEPDIIILNQETIDTETRWETESIIQNASSVKLIAEVVSSNWQDDYYDKLRDYEGMGIPEYWIVDYAALGGRKFIGNPKQPTIFVCELIDDEYQMTPFRGGDLIVSPTFPQLNLTPQQIFDWVL
ncbi:Uma2 family endonuclease [Aetokthonos hydrillicola Thurmond2011]|jgi:Uma2 family endonuclease|uniref:Uma2 family endonuclease n=1 Tax=Aetokthonos hydrillicola Thurmond2011 TaxID=2712845 RepID=A0AAP5I360_9CYAN|nr:Uma2 family endonuclease [Aetokthonos hydrillicola]MBO3458357.1 Uma2 family endonuclease [Aetokthonos hydrillicola CCALA 1050]MBW4585922.1 Uma2 family endonuclease [Aetokthonos hydrillicola CCALA 1050]MDR9893851.1 Uma2 family endonuclease [Aetokthonos hydrillicola Thurmond2011]